MNFDQNRKLQAKSGRRARGWGSCAHISEEKPEQHQTALNATDAKTRFYFCWKPKTESGIEQELQTAIVTKKPTNQQTEVF